MWKKLLKEPGFWTIVYSFVITIAFLVMLIKWSNHDCPKPNYDAIEQRHQKELYNLQNKIYEYQIKELQTNAVIDRLNDNQLDSIWATIHR
jgi:hypothetical protein